jgi:hypothetical protein
MDLSKTPLMLSPSGDPPDFANGPSLEKDILGSGIAFLVTVGPTLALRLATNLKVAQIGLDDCKLGCTTSAIDSC